MRKRPRAGRAKPRPKPRAKARPKPPRPTSKPSARRRPAPAGVVSQAAFARHRGVSRQAVARAIAEGRIHALADGRIDVAIADRAWDANTDPARAAPPALPAGVVHPRPPDESADGAPSDISYANARAMHEYFKAQLAELELRVRRSELAPVAELQDAEFKVARAVRDRLLTLPEALCDQIAGVEGVTAAAAEVRRILAAGINGVCRELSTELAEQATEEQAS